MRHAAIAGPDISRRPIPTNAAVSVWVRYHPDEHRSDISIDGGIQQSAQLQGPVLATSFACG